MFSLCCVGANENTHTHTHDVTRRVNFPQTSIKQEHRQRLSCTNLRLQCIFLAYMDIFYSTDRNLPCVILVRTENTQVFSCRMLGL